MASFGKFEDSDFQAFIKHFDNQVQGKQFLREIELAFVELVAETVDIIRNETPEDTGWLKEGWKASNIKRSGGSLFVEISNGVEYAVYVNFGHRTRGGGWVNGIFMMEKGLAEVQQIIDEYLEEAFERALMKLLEG
jgi:hypothetical protein